MSSTTTPTQSLSLLTALAFIVPLSTFASSAEEVAALSKVTYHNNPQRTGWNAHESTLTPLTVSGKDFGPLWRSQQFDWYEDVPPRLYASPLYVDDVEILAGAHANHRFSLIYAVTSTGYVYAVNAFAKDTVAPGAILWSARLTDNPCHSGAFGNLSTPIIDLARKRLYVTSCDTGSQWRVHSLDIRSGKESAGWPVTLSRVALNAPGINKNGNTRFPQIPLIQRGALNLSPDGSRLYIAFGGDFASGWIVAVDTALAAVATAFSTTGRTEEAQGGMWASGGPSVDAQGYVHIATGANVSVATNKVGIKGVFPESESNWGQSVIRLRDDAKRGFELTGTYTPFNYCQAAAADIDLGSSGTIVIDLDGSTTSTPLLLALGGAKQGNAYLLDRANMPGSLKKRPTCSKDPTSDLSLLAPSAQPHFGQRGPVNVFGPYSDSEGMNDQARSRTTPAYFRDANRRTYLFITGSAKAGENLTTSVPPGLARLEIVASPEQPAYLRIDQLEWTQTFLNPGSPIVTSNGSEDAIIWILDQNAPKTAAIYGPNAPQPVLYAFDALTLKLLWKSAPGMLRTSGRYNEPAVVRGVVFVGTDRIEAFGLRTDSADMQALAALTAQRDKNSPVGPARESRKERAEAFDEAGYVDAESLYMHRCGGCHNSQRPDVPTRAALGSLSQKRIVEVLQTGAMQTQAFGLSRREIAALAAYLSTLGADERTSN